MLGARACVVVEELALLQRCVALAASGVAALVLAAVSNPWHRTAEVAMDSVTRRPEEGTVSFPGALLQSARRCVCGFYELVVVVPRDRQSRDVLDPPDPHHPRSGTVDYLRLSGLVDLVRSVVLSLLVTDKYDDDDCCFRKDSSVMIKCWRALLARRPLIHRLTALPDIPSVPPLKSQTAGQPIDGRRHSCSVI